MTTECDAGRCRFFPHSPRAPGPRGSLDVRRQLAHEAAHGVFYWRAQKGDRARCVSVLTRARSVFFLFFSFSPLDDEEEGGRQRGVVARDERRAKPMCVEECVCRAEFDALDARVGLSRRHALTVVRVQW